MQNEESRIGVEELFIKLLDMCKHMVAGPDGRVPEEMTGAFETVSRDVEGLPVIQTLTGMVMVPPDKVEGDNRIYYSPNLAADNEQLSIELLNFSKYLASVGYELIACTAHFVDYQGQCSYGAEARKVKDYVDQTLLLQKIKHLQENPDPSKPKLILPDDRIIR